MGVTTKTPLWELRAARGLSQSELARRAVVAEWTIVKAERHGMVPKPRSRRRIARALGVSEDDIAWGLTRAPRHDNMIVEGGRGNEEGQRA